MEWAGDVSASLTPFGDGCSVCGGVEPRIDGVSHKAAVTLDLRPLGSGCLSLGRAPPSGMIERDGRRFR
jgi:hypothetical protein